MNKENLIPTRLISGIKLHFYSKLAMHYLLLSEWGLNLYENESSYLKL